MTASRKGSEPDKICAVCGRPFSWRRKWKRDWDTVRYCSKHCRGARTSASSSPSR